MPLNFPYHLIDSTLVTIALICVNLMSGAACQITGLIFIILRLILTFYVPFYNAYNQQYYKLIVISSVIASLGLLVSFFSINRNYNLIFIAILVGYLLFVHGKKEEVPVWQEVVVEEAQV